MAAKQFNCPATPAPKDPRMTDPAKIKLINYDYAKYGASAETPPPDCALGKETSTQHADNGGLGAPARDPHNIPSTTRAPGAPVPARACVGAGPGPTPLLFWYALPDGNGCWPWDSVVGRTPPAPTADAGVSSTNAWLALGLAVYAGAACCPYAAWRGRRAAAGRGALGWLGLLAVVLSSAHGAGLSMGWRRPHRRSYRGPAGHGLGCQHCAAVPGGAHCVQLARLLWVGPVCRLGGGCAALLALFVVFPCLALAAAFFDEGGPVATALFERVATSATQPGLGLAGQGAVAWPGTPVFGLLTATSTTRFWAL